MRMLHHCGLPASDIDFIHCGGRVMNEVIERAPFRMTQFTGSSDVAEKLAALTRGKIRVEDAGFDWKILGPDVDDVEYVSWQCDQDAYAATGQKCSAQSILFAHKNWMDAGLVEKLRSYASRRSLSNLTIGAVLTESTERILSHTQRLLKIPGSKLLFGGAELPEHTIPQPYGAVPPTAVYVPLEQILASDDNFEAATTEIFGPFQARRETRERRAAPASAAPAALAPAPGRARMRTHAQAGTRPLPPHSPPPRPPPQVITSFSDGSEDKVIAACERMEHHLTAAVVSNDAAFRTKLLANTVNGTTYAGRRARTTGAPQNHWFGPCGDPRGAGIGTIEAIKLVWSCHREIIIDELPTPEGWTPPEAS